jgi:hypothetical protein
MVALDVMKMIKSKGKQEYQIKVSGLIFMSEFGMF